MLGSGNLTLVDELFLLAVELQATRARQAAQASSGATEVKCLCNLSIPCCLQFQSKQGQLTHQQALGQATASCK